MAVSTFHELLAHAAHEVEVVTYGDQAGGVANVAIECERCGEVLLDFEAPESVTGGS